MRQYMIQQKCSGLRHASSTTTGVEAATFTTEGDKMLMAAAFTAHALQNRSQVDHTPGSPQTRALRAVAENDPSHSAASETQASTAPPVGTTVSVRAYAAHGQAQHQPSCPGCGSAIKRILA